MIFNIKKYKKKKKKKKKIIIIINIFRSLYLIKYNGYNYLIIFSYVKIFMFEVIFHI